MNNAEYTVSTGSGTYHGISTIAEICCRDSDIAIVAIRNAEIDFLEFVMIDSGTCAEAEGRKRIRGRG